MQHELMILSIGGLVQDPYGGQYIIEALLGRGGSGAVYRIRDRHFEQHLYALKDLIEPDKHDLARFTFEGELLQRLAHRALPRVYCVFEREQPRGVYMLMDFIEGRDLKDLLKEQPAQRFTLSQVLVILEPIVDALHYLHCQDPPIVHRDVKPANIIVPTRGDNALLVDFGIAKEYVADATTSAIRYGSPGYAAPEQYGSGTAPRTDIYGLGATLYALLTGMIPPDAITRATASRGVDPLRPANLITPDVPRAIATAIERAMSISLADRFETIEEFWQEVTAHASQPQERSSHVTSVATSQSPPEQNVEKMAPASLSHQPHASIVKRHRSLSSLILALLLGVAIGAAIFTPFVMHSSSSTSVHTITHAPVPPTRAHEPSIYPGLAASYAGTVLDLLNKEKTAMFLTKVQQSQGQFRGFFQGLGLVGPFTGAVTPSGHVQFTVAVQPEDVTLVFQGDIKIGGDITGSFTVLNHQGYQTGETGIWNVAASP